MFPRRFYDCLERLQIEIVEQFYIFNRTPSITGRPTPGRETPFSPLRCGCLRGVCSPCGYPSKNPIEAGRPASVQNRKKGTRRRSGFPLSLAMVPKAGFEPARVSPPPPQDGDHRASCGGFPRSGPPISPRHTREPRLSHSGRVRLHRGQLHHVAFVPISFRPLPRPRNPPVRECHLIF